MQLLGAKGNEEFMELAWQEAGKARCADSQFGAVIVKDGLDIARGRNEPVGEECEQCIRADKSGGVNAELCFAVHAEQNALIDALHNHADVRGAVMYIGGYKKGEKRVFKGKPFCTVCSRLIAASGIKGVVLYAEGGYAFLESGEFNEASFNTMLERHGLKMARKAVKASSTPRNL